MHSPVWIDLPPGSTRPRVDRAVFRRAFTLAEPPVAADLHFLARMRCLLRVNGVEVASGPVRSYPEFHEYDSCDLKPFLVAGENVLETEVLHWDMATFHNLKEPPAFEAWGKIVAPDGSEADLATPGEWRCRRLHGVDASAPRLSFAQPPVECLDFRDDEGSWSTPVPAAPDPTTSPLPRSIPPLTRIPLSPASLVAADVPPTGESVFGARLVDDGDGSAPFPPRDRFGALAVWIHSPTAQSIEAGGWWGEYVLNGTPVPVAPDPVRPLRQTLSLALRPGWNKLAVTQRLAFGYAEFCIALPDAAGLSLRTAPDPNAATGFWFLPAAIAEDDLRRILPELSSESPRLPDLPWQCRDIAAAHPSPLRHVAWALPGAPLRVPAPDGALRLPAGSATLVTLDMGRIVLGRLSLDLDAPAGTLLDFAHAEEPRNGTSRPRVKKAVVVYGADRWIAAAGHRRYTAATPRGFRYLDLLVEVPAGGPDAILHGAEVWEERYPYDFGDEARATFGDDTFDRLWAYSRRTLELCANDVFVDCPWRERTLYGGDLLPEMAANVVFAPHDLRLVRHSIDVVLQSLGPDGWLQSNAPSPRGSRSLGEYPLLTSIAAGWYLRLTDDRAFAERAWPVFRILSETVAAWRRPDGIYALPGRSFIDHGRRLCEGPTCEFNAALTAAFRAWAVAARLAGDPVAADSLAARANALDRNVSTEFFDTAAGTFRDLPLADGGTETEGTPANSWALLFTRSARAHSRECARAIRVALETYSPSNEPNSASPYQMFYLLMALHAIGEDELAERAIRLVYADMLAHPTGTLWEHGGSGQSLVHAWSSGVAAYLADARLGRDLGFPEPPDSVLS